MKKHHHHCFWLILFLSIWIVSPALSSEKGTMDKINVLMGKAEEMLRIDPSKAIYYANSAIAIAQEMKDRASLAMAQASLGEAYINQGDFDLGFEAITSAMENCPDGDDHLKAFVYVRLSSAYRKLGDLQRAFEYVDMAVDIYKILQDDLHLATCYNARGLIYILTLDNKQAEINFKQALDINRRIENYKQVAANLNNLCLYEGDTQEKIAMLHEAIAINESFGLTWSLGENYNNLGTQYFYAKEYVRALQALDNAKRYAQSINAKELISDNYRYASWVYAAQKKYLEAYENLRNLYDTEHELLAKDEMRKIELDLIQKQMKTQEQRMLIKEQSFQIRNLRMRSFIAILTSIAVLLLLCYVVIHSRQQKKIQMLEAAKKLDMQERELIDLKLLQAENEAHSTQAELDYNRQELTNFAFFVRSRNDLLAHIQSMLKEGYKLSGQEMDVHLRCINAYISQFNAQNSETELLIDKVNARFIDKLSSLHPDLSKNEQRLASLLRIGLSSKEIASVIDSNPKTVNMARYRLRKHLNLETDDSLTDYMKSI